MWYVRLRPLGVKLKICDTWQTDLRIYLYRCKWYLFHSDNCKSVLLDSYCSFFRFSTFHKNLNSFTSQDILSQSSLSTFYFLWNLLFWAECFGSFSILTLRLLLRIFCRKTVRNICTGTEKHLLFIPLKMNFDSIVLCLHNVSI